MRHLPYTWETILNEEVPRTLISIELLNKEKEAEKNAYEKAKNKGRK